ncbi:cytochrome c family protein [Lysobacter concretionis Ko07 = DSM 16239]|uniref:Cytochrome c family protein n=2 Tax=Novilysobacter TaxID=3382699 RepID=A0A0A0EMJ2_9GAMM|nr:MULTISPECIES: cytochrome c [Lysobacter]KGM51619.1 cytochrome c family protein [Lysobacter concretionis Ko07 = DSM 16239]QOD90003.1 cytochrome c [Lysobacter sp. CW239]QOW18450.1 cytochrome c [Lysobacter ciconiae]
MQSKTRQRVWLIAVPLIVAVGAVGFVWGGVYNVAADDMHTRPVHFLLETARERSILTRAGRVEVPSGLDEPARIVQGAGNYAAMCAGCHLAPSMAETEMSQGLNPAPPDLSKYEVDAAKAFWVIKHGIKASGMPAWGKNMDDEYIWNMAAFLQLLPTLDAAAYKELVDSSQGHAHGGGETQGDGHVDAAAEDHPAPSEPANNAMPHTPPPGVDDDHHGSIPGDAEVGMVESNPAPDTPEAGDGHTRTH